MSTREFIPLTPPVGIPGSSYSIQIGHINGVYHVQIKRGRSVIATVKLYSLDINEITAVVYSSMKLPMFNMYNISKAVGRALNALESNIEKQPYGEPISVESNQTAHEYKAPPTKPVTESHQFTSSEQPSPVKQPVSQYTKSTPKTLEGLIKQEKEKIEKSSTAKIEHLSLEEKWERSVATINLILAFVNTFLKEKYGDDAVKAFWEYYASSNAKLWQSMPIDSLDEAISNIVQWLEIHGVVFSQYSFENNIFQGIVDDCLFKKRSDSLRSLGFSIPEELPCELCKYQLSKICEILNLSFSHEKEGTYCKITFQPKKGEKKVIL